MIQSAYRKPETLLDELGISDPAEIKIEAIAQHCRATVIYEPLSGCDARIIGHGDRAIITVDSTAPRERQRFSAGHELGHWLRDRGSMAFSCADRALVGEWGNDENPERRANRFAADLLLPRRLFAPRAREVEPTISGVRSLASEFETSITATAIRLVEMNYHPAIVVCTAQQGRKWFTRSELVPKVLWPKTMPGDSTTAAKLLGGVAVPTGPVVVDADDWIDHDDSSAYSVVEDSIWAGAGLVLSLVWWRDEKQILALEGED